MDNQYFYSSDNFMSKQMGTCKPLQNKYSDCTYPMQPMMPQENIFEEHCLPNVDLYKYFHFPTMHPMYSPHMLYHYQVPVSMENMYLINNPELRKGEEITPQQLIPVQPIKLPVVKPTIPMMPEIKPLPEKEVLPIEIMIKKTEFTHKPQHMMYPVMECLPCIHCGVHHFPWEPCHFEFIPHTPCFIDECQAGMMHFPFVFPMNEEY